MDERDVKRFVQVHKNTSRASYTSPSLLATMCSLSLLRFFSCGFSRAFQGHLKPPAPVLAYFFRDVKCFHFSQTDGSHQKLLFSTSLLVKEAQWMQSFRTGPFYLTTWTETQLLTLLSHSRSWLSDRTSPKSISQARVAIAHAATSGSRLFKAIGQQWWKQNYNV